MFFPLLLLSEVLLPVDQARPNYAAASRASPLTFVAEAEQALFNGNLTAPAAGYGLLAATAIIAGLATGSPGHALRRALTPPPAIRPGSWARYGR